jgi:hypothetical protein
MTTTLEANTFVDILQRHRIRTARDAQLLTEQQKLDLITMYGLNRVDLQKRLDMLIAATDTPLVDPQENKDLKRSASVYKSVKTHNHGRGRVMDGVVRFVALCVFLYAHVDHGFVCCFTAETLE